MLSAFEVLLHRYSGQSDVVVGTPIAGRRRIELEGLMGLFINTVALRTDLSGAPLFTELLSRVRRTTLDAQANQDLPFEKLVETLQPDRTLSHAPVFQVMFNLTPMPERKVMLSGLEMEMDRLLDHGVATFDLTLSIGEHAGGLELIWEYDSDLFDRETIDRMGDHYERLIGSVLDDVQRSICALPMLTPAEEQAIIRDWNPAPAETISVGADWQPVHRLFEAQVDRDPDAIAVIDGNLRLTYRQLEARANRLAPPVARLRGGPRTRRGSVHRAIRGDAGLRAGCS